MNVPVEISFRDVVNQKELERMIRDKCARLERICNYLSSCRVAVERTQKHQHRGQRYRVRLELGVPPGHRLTVTREPHEGEVHTRVEREIRDAFEAAERQLKELKEKQHGEVKRHPAQETGAVVQSVNREQGFGFLQTVDGRSLYFHRNAVLEGDFDRLEQGTGVRYLESSGEDGPSARSVEIVDKPGARIAR